MIKKIKWIGSAKKNLQKMPQPVKAVFGYGLHIAQTGSRHDKAKVLKAFKAATVLELVENYQNNTYRAVYTLTALEKVHVLHCFMKKSGKGISTPRNDFSIIVERYKSLKQGVNSHEKHIAL